jgi:hypothetical protein
LAAVLGALAVPARSGAAGEPDWTFTPTTVSDGTAVSAQGTGCVDPDTGSSDGLHVVVFGERLYHPYSLDTSSRLTMVAEAAADGTWSVSGTVSTYEGYYLPHEDFTTTATAYCYGSVMPATQIGGPITLQYEADTSTGPGTTAPSTSTSMPVTTTVPAPFVLTVGDPTPAAGDAIEVVGTGGSCDRVSIQLRESVGGFVGFHSTTKYLERSSAGTFDGHLVVRDTAQTGDELQAWAACSAEIATADLVVSAPAVEPRQTMRLLSPQPLIVGAAATVAGGGCDPGAPVVVEIHQRGAQASTALAARGTADGSGNWEITGTVVDNPPGDEVLIATCAAPGLATEGVALHYQPQRVQIADAPAPTSPPDTEAPNPPAPPSPASGATAILGEPTLTG